MTRPAWSFIRVALIAACSIGLCGGAAPPRATVPLVWYVETGGGAAADSRAEDQPVNPASIVKLATTLHALERLGPDHRYETRIGPGANGDLLVLGGGDPDFHVENAFLVARELNRLGVRDVRGALRVSDEFWIGWEGGSARRIRDPRRRAEQMASRLRDALDPARWNRQTRRAFAEFSARRGLAVTSPPGVVVRGGVGRLTEARPERVLLVHRSNPLRETLKRFNAYSNNDIERLADPLGVPGLLAASLAERFEVPAEQVAFSSYSGLGQNRLTPRLVVRLLRELDAVCSRLGLRIEDVLPVSGCDPGTLASFPRLEAGELDRALVAKTGTLTATDGGVAVLAGLVATEAGRRIFCVVAPASGKHPARARAAQEGWLLDLVEGLGGARPGRCGAPVVFSDAGAEVAGPN